MPTTLNPLLDATSLPARSQESIPGFDPGLTTTMLSRLALAHQDWEHADAYERGVKDVLKSLLPAIESFIDGNQPPLSPETRHHLRRTLHAFEDHVWRYVRGETREPSHLVADVFVEGGLGI